jgi:hypothetical protein
MAIIVDHQFSGFIWNKIESYQRGSKLLSLHSDCVAATNEKALLQYAKHLRNGTECHYLPYVTMGGVHLIRLLGFADGVRWIARIQLRPSTAESAQRMKSEIDTMVLLRQRSAVPVPEVYYFELDDDNAVGRAFVLMECVPGNAAMDLDGGHSHHHGGIPAYRKEAFFRGVAAVQVGSTIELLQSIVDMTQVQLSSVRLPKIGTVICNDDGSINVGPIPNIGGPFDTAADFFKAWAVATKYPLSEDTIRTRTGKFADDIIASTKGFPSQIKALAVLSSAFNGGPFPLMHPDLYQSNIIVDDNYKVLGVIDWEGAHSVPWEILEFPLFLSVVPPPMDAPWNYDSSGQPKDPETRQAWEDRRLYRRMVEESEGQAGIDNRLSSVLRNSAAQYLAYAIRQYPEGKVGPYGRVLEGLVTNYGGK